MQNSVIIKDENGNDIKIEVLFQFNVEEYGKNYIAYTINDDGKSERVAVLISEIDIQNNKIISIPDNEINTVLDIYNQIKQQIS